MRVEILVGWISFAIMIPLLLTSNDQSVRKMGTDWKRLQRWVYPAAMLAYIPRLADHLSDRAGSLPRP
ncbi:MAG: hypothetical protein R3D61_09635 [Defluviimonas denitrificans]